LIHFYKRDRELFSWASQVRGGGGGVPEASQAIVQQDDFSGQQQSVWVPARFARKGTKLAAHSVVGASLLLQPLQPQNRPV